MKFKYTVASKYHYTSESRFKKHQHKIVEIASSLPAFSKSLVADPMMLVQPVRPVCGPARAAPKKTPLERELEGIRGIPLKQLGQPRAEVRGRVSVVTPTTASRARFHPQLWRCFLDQSWQDKELVVVETYHDQPSAFFRRIAREDTRLKYVAIKCPVGEDLTVGAKRNLTILLASGEYCLNFDDDDLYADKYVERMVTEMKKRSLVALTLSGWHNFFEARGCAGYSEPNAQLMGSRRSG